MNYLLLIFGIGLVIIALVLFIMDRKKTSSEIQDLERANAQTEYLIEELNELSSIIVDEMEKKYIKMLDIYQELLAVSAVEQKEREEPKQEKQTEKKTKVQSMRNKILELHEAGSSPVEIASQTGTGIGEVELIIKFAQGSVES
jgi:IS30 family transposase